MAGLFPIGPRPIICNDCPPFQRLRMSVFCAADNPTRFPWVIDTTSEEKNLY